MPKVMTRPPIKKPITAMSEGNCRLDNPLIACPEVQPPAHRVPNPTRNPPTTMIKKPLMVSKPSIEKMDLGASPPSKEIPSCCKSVIVLWANAKSLGLENTVCAMKPPMTAPPTNTRFHICDFHSNLKKSDTFPAPPIAQRERRVEDTPKLPPATKRRNITRASIGPDTYQGHG